MSEHDDDIGHLRKPPANIEAEQAVLGGLLLDNNALDRIGFLKAAGFYDSRNRRIFEAIESTILAHKPADVLTVMAAIEKPETDDAEYLRALSFAVPSASNIRRYAEIVNERAIDRAIIVAADEAATLAFSQAGTLADRIDKITTAFAQFDRGQSRKGPRSLADLLTERIDRATAIHDGQADDHWPTGIPALDKAMNGGLRPGSVMVLAARPSVGKSSFAEALGLSLARAGHPVLMLSQEMPDFEIADRAISNLGRLDYGMVQTAKFGNDDWGRLSEAVETGSRIPFYVDDEPALTIGQVRAKARSVKGLRVLVLDYLQLCSATGRDSNRNGQVEEVSRGLKALAKQLGMAVIMLSQLNREVEKRTSKRPMLADLRDSGAIEQDADIVLMLWMHTEYPEAKLIGCEIAKNRQGKTFDFGLHFDGKHQRWAESNESVAAVAFQGREL